MAKLLVMTLERTCKNKIKNVCCKVNHALMTTQILNLTEGHESTVLCLDMLSRLNSEDVLHKEI